MIVYKAVNKKNGKCYVGQTVRTLDKRKYSHGLSAKNGEAGYPFHRALLKYGEENFEWHVLCECSSKKEMDEKEIYYIQELKSHIKEGGYNLTFGGGGNLGYVPTEETRRKISKSNKGKQLGIPKSEEHKKKIGLGQLGNKRPHQMGDNNVSHRPEVKEKISKSLKGKKRPYMIERNKLNIGKSYDELYGKERANEIKRKQSEKHKNKIVSDETKKKMSESGKGTSKPTMMGDNNPSKRPEVREKIRQKALERWNRINNET